MKYVKTTLTIKTPFDLVPRDMTEVRKAFAELEKDIEAITRNGQKAELKVDLIDE